LELNNVLTLIEQCKKPIIVGICGHCTAEDIQIISMCDIRICSKYSSFSATPAIGAKQRVQSIVGNHSWVNEVCLTGRKFMAPEAKEFGLVSRIEQDYKSLLISCIQIAELISSNVNQVCATPRLIKDIPEDVHDEPVTLNNEHKEIDSPKGELDQIMPLLAVLVINSPGMKATSSTLGSWLKNMYSTTYEEFDKPIPKRLFSKLPPYFLANSNGKLFRIKIDKLSDGAYELRALKIKANKSDELVLEITPAINEIVSRKGLFRVPILHWKSPNRHFMLMIAALLINSAELKCCISNLGTQLETMIAAQPEFGKCLDGKNLKDLFSKLPLMYYASNNGRFYRISTEYERKELIARRIAMKQYYLDTKLYRVDELCQVIEKVKPSEHINVKNDQ
jgi:enoyl-CoA hydratase/carnithine racemase